jgi:hypothetical protein
LLRVRRPLGIRSAIADAAGFWTFCPNTQIAPRFDHERLILGALRFEISLSVAEVFSHDQVKVFLVSPEALEARVRGE